MSAEQGPFSGKVLIVDDDAVIRMLASEALKQAGFQVWLASDGAQVPGLLAESTPDIILLDVLMPGMDGFATCTELRKHEQWADLPVVMMTGLDDVESIQTAYQSGATDFITKPIQWQMLPYRAQYLIRSGNAYKELQINRALLSQAQRLACIGSWVWYMADNRFYCSEELCHILKQPYYLAKRSSDSLFKLIHPSDHDLVKSALDQAIANRSNFSIDHRVLLADGTELQVHTEAILESDGQKQPDRLLGIMQDISERKQAEQKISYLAYYDTLTRLPNRLLFNDRLSQALLRAERSNQQLAVLFIDLDDFKLINDTHGHRVGDLLLEAVSRRLEQTTRAGDTLARLGGDEFIILLHDVKSNDNTMMVALKILNNLTGAYNLEDKQLFISASIGIAHYPEHGTTAEKLMKSADSAMYQAKAQGKNHIEVFTHALYSQASERLLLQPAFPVYCNEVGGRTPIAS
jgi:diguanylate cyclase (GGDEF)-like protein